MSNGIPLDEMIASVECAAKGIILVPNGENL